MLVKTSIICLLMILYMIGFYYRKPHIPVKSTRIFQMLTGVALVNTLFDLITIYTVNHRDQVPEVVNLVAHIIYLLSILIFVYLLFIYLRSYLEGNRNFSRALRFWQTFPLVMSSLGILILPITYVHGTVTDYSLGPKAYALYVSLVIYLVLILYYCLRYWEALDGDKRLTILLAVPIYAVIAVIQMLRPETLLVIVASTLIMLGLILSNENTEKYMDEKTSLFNQFSFETVLDETDFERQRMFVAVLCFCRTENSIDWEQNSRIFQDIHREIRQFRLQGYRVCENGVAFITNSEDRARMVLEEVKNALEEQYGKEKLLVAARLLPEENTISKQNCMRSVIAFCTETGSHFAYIDYLTHIYNRNAFERDIAKLREDGEGYYIIADLNGLKAVNDTIGHSAGDELLQGFARLLADTTGDQGRVYRQGGDEFAVLYSGDAEGLVHELEKQCRIHNQTCNIPISYAIGYCHLKEEDFLNVADQRMYEDKRRIKQGRSGVS